MAADDDVDWTWFGLAQDGVDIIQAHVVNQSLVDLLDFIPISEDVRRSQPELKPVVLASLFPLLPQSAINVSDGSRRDCVNKDP